MSDDGADEPLEVIELEPAAPSSRPRDPHTATTGVRGRKIPIVVAVVIVVGLVVSVAAGRSPHHARSAAAASTTNARDTTINLRGGGQLFASRVGAELLTAGADGLRLIDTDTGTATTPSIPGLPIGPLRIVTHSGATVAVSLGAYLYWFTLPNGVAHRVDATRAFPAAESGHLWLATDTVATEVPGGTDGLPSSRVVTAHRAIGAVHGGLLEQAEPGLFDTGNVGRVVVQPVDGRGNVHTLLPGGATVIGVHADRVAWVTNDCGVLRCPVHISETADATGASSAWFQLPGHPSDLALQSAVALFSPDGDRLAVVVPDDSVTRANTLVVGDLRTRTTTVVNTTGFLSAPGDATGMTVDWTRDGNYIVIAPQVGAGSGRLGAIDPANGRVQTSRVGRDGDTSVAATGTSALGALDLPRRLHQPIATGPGPRLGAAGLQLVGADTTQVDVLDLGSGRVRTFHTFAVVPNPAGPFSIARVTTGWLIVRNGIVSLLRDSAASERGEFVDAGTQVLSARGGRIAWIAAGSPRGTWHAATYDPATGRRGPAVEFSGDLAGAVDGGLVYTRPPVSATALDRPIVLVDEAGHQRTLASVYSNGLTVLATGGDTIVASNDTGVDLIDATTGTSRILTFATVNAAAVSPDGTNVAWIDSEGHALAARVSAGFGAPIHDAAIDATADRVLVANDGTILATHGVQMWQGKVGEQTTQRVYALAVDPSSELALG